MAADPYSLLGVARGASEADIKKAYRTLAKSLHPDRNQGKADAADRFAAVTSAYDLLSDAAKRARFDRGEIDGDGNPTSPFGAGSGGFGGGFGGDRYDPRRSAAQGNPWGPQAGGASGGFGGDADVGGIFDELFGGRGRRTAPPRGANVGYRLAISFIDAATLALQRITLRDGMTIDLKLPNGVENGTQMRLAGKGDRGPGGAGDATVTIDIKPHPFFERSGSNVRVDLPVTLAEAVDGAKVKVPTVDGPVMLAIPAGSTSGRVLRLKGRGFTRKDGTRGDQLVTVMIDVPGDDAALKQFLAQWSDPRNVRATLGV